MQNVNSVFNDLFSGVSTNGLTAFLNNPFTASMMFEVILIFLTVMIMATWRSFEINALKMRHQSYNWFVRAVVVGLMTTSAFVVTASVFVLSVEMYGQLNLNPAGSYREGFAHPVLLLVLTAILFSKLSVNDRFRGRLINLIFPRPVAET